MALFTIIFVNKPEFFKNLFSKIFGKTIFNVEIYIDDKSKPKYTLGACKKDSDCKPSGCSKEICTSDPNLETTCEYKTDFPDTLVYSCGCIENKCVWFKE